MEEPEKTYLNFLLTLRIKTDIFILRLEGVAKRLPERYKVSHLQSLFLYTEVFDVTMLY